MKKWLFLVIISSIILFSLSFAKADVKYDVHGANCSIQLPEDWIYGDYSSEHSKEMMSLMGMQDKEWYEWLDDYGFAFYAVPAKSPKALSLTISPDGMRDFSGQEEGILLTTGKTIANYTQVDGYEEIEKIRILKGDVPFIKVFYTNLNDNSQYVEYITVVNRKRYTISLTSLDQNTHENEMLMDAIAGSMQFNEIEVKRFGIRELSMLLRIPQNWTILDRETREAIQNKMDYRFYAVSPDYQIRMHVDMINENSALASLSGFSAEEKNQIIPTFDPIIKSMYGSDKIKIELAEFNRVTYVKTDVDLQLTDTPMREISFITIKNHKMYAITFDPITEEDGEISEESQYYIQYIMENISYTENNNEENSIDLSDSQYYSKYSINVPSINIGIPGNYYVFWKGMPANAYSIIATGNSIDEWDKIFESNGGLILNAEDYISDKTIILSYTDMPVPDFSNITEEELKNYIFAYLKPQGEEENGLRDGKYKIIETTSYKFVLSVADCVDPKYGGVGFANVFSVKNGKSLSLGLRSGKAVTDEDIEELIKVLTTIEIEGVKQNLVHEGDWISETDKVDKIRTYERLNMVVPLNYIVYDQATTDKDLILNMKGLNLSDVQAVMNQLKSESLIANYDSSVIMYLSINSISRVPDFDSLFSENIKNEVIPTMENSYKQLGAKDIESELLYTAEMKDKNKVDEIAWIKTKMKAIDGTTKIIYMTIFHGKQYTFTVESTSTNDFVGEDADKILKSGEFNVN